MEYAEPSRDRLLHGSPRGSAFVPRKLRSPGFRVQRILKRYKNPGSVPVLIEAPCSNSGEKWKHDARILLVFAQ